MLDQFVTWLEQEVKLMEWFHERDATSNGMLTASRPCGRVTLTTAQRPEVAGEIQRWFETAPYKRELGAFRNASMPTSTQSRQCV